jgi:hypothetical protein
VTAPPPEEAVKVTPAATPPPAPAEGQPVYKKWWLWTIVGGVAVVAVGVGVGVAYGSQTTSPPPSHFGTISF